MRHKSGEPPLAPPLGGDELVAAKGAANPAPDPTELEDEPFSTNDVVDRVEQTSEALAPVPPTRPRLMHSLSVAVAAFVLVVAAVAAGALLTRGDVPVAGNVDPGCEDIATDPGESMDSFESSDYNPFVGIQQALVSQSTGPFFFARVTGPVSANELYFRLVNLESFNGELFHANRPNLQALDVQPWIDPCHAWTGPASAGTVDVVIERLRTDWMPSPVSPVALSGNQDVVEDIRVRFADGSFRLDGALSNSGMAYAVEVEIPRIDVGALITDAEGTLTPLFAAAATAGESLPATHPPALTRVGPPDRNRHLALPFDESDKDRLRALAESVTTRAASAFDSGLQLEVWFHSQAFAYTLPVETDLGKISITSWLLDPESPRYRVGYAEQFSAAFAVLARALDIPSRVVFGFAPGDLEDGETMVVRDRSAHAWVELWMAQHGWMSFDPTPRPAGDGLPTHQTLADELGFDLTPYLTD